MQKYEICELCGKEVNGSMSYPVYRGMHLIDEHNVTNIPTLDKLTTSGKFFIWVEQ